MITHIGSKYITMLMTLEPVSHKLSKLWSLGAKSHSHYIITNECRVKWILSPAKKSPRRVQSSSRPPKIATLFRIAEITCVKRHTVDYQGPWWSHNDHACTNHWGFLSLCTKFQAVNTSLPHGERSSIPGIQQNGVGGTNCELVYCIAFLKP